MRRGMASWPSRYVPGGDRPGARWRRGPAPRPPARPPRPPPSRAARRWRPARCRRGPRPWRGPGSAAGRAAGLVRRHPHHLVLDRARLVQHVEVAHLTSRRMRAPGCARADGPGGQRRDDPGAVQRQLARGLGEDLVVTDEHAHPAQRGVERREALAGLQDARARPAAGAPCGGGRGCRRRSGTRRWSTGRARPARCSPRRSRSRRRSGSAASSRRRRRSARGGPTRSIMPGTLRLLQVAAQRGLGKHHQPRATRARAGHDRPRCGRASGPRRGRSSRPPPPRPRSPTACEPLPNMIRMLPVAGASPFGPRSKMRALRFDTLSRPPPGVR